MTAKELGQLYHLNREIERQKNPVRNVTRLCDKIDI